MPDNHWEDARRVAAWAGEARVNLVRAVALAAFYAHHLFYVYVRSDDPTVRGPFNAAVSIVVLGWFLAVVVLYVCLSRRWAPPALKYVATAWDLLLLTALLVVNPDGPRSPLMYLYFVLVAASPLRLSLPLVYATTLGAAAGAAAVLGYYVFYRVGAAAYYDPEKGLRLSRTAEVIYLLSLLTTGLLAGQVVRQARQLFAGYPVTVVERRQDAA
jgi:hypothetical protein